MRRLIAVAALFAVALVPMVCTAATYNVDASMSASTAYGILQSAVAGDTVLLGPGTYAFRVLFTKQATAQNPITIAAQDPANPPVVDSGSTLVENLPGSSGAGDRGRGIWQFVNSAHYRVSNITFRNAKTSSENAAGIRFYNTVGLQIRYCKFDSNENGLAGGNGYSDVLVEWCEFVNNGHPGASDPTHSIYSYGGNFTMRYSYLRRPTQAQNFHMRCKYCLLEYNFIADASSYAGDLMPSNDGDQQQTMILRGNIIIQGGFVVNRGQHIAVYNDAGRSGWAPTLIMEHNTLVIAQPNTATVHLSNANGDGTYTLVMTSNILTANAYLAQIPAATSVSGTNNYNDAAKTNGALSNTFTGSGSPFVDTASYAPVSTLSLAGNGVVGTAAPLYWYICSNTTHLCTLRSRADGGSTIGAVPAAGATSGPTSTAAAGTTTTGTTTTAAATPTGGMTSSTASTATGTTSTGVSGTATSTGSSTPSTSVMTNTTGTAAAGTSTTTAAPPPTTTAAATPTATRAPRLRARLRITGSSFGEIVFSSNTTLVAELRLAVRADIARRLRIAIAFVQVWQLAVGSLVADFDVTADAPITGSDAASTMQASPASNWLGSTQTVYGNYTTGGMAGETLSSSTVTVVAVSDQTAAPNNGSEDSPGCEGACVGFFVAAAAGALLIVLAVIVYCCCCRAKREPATKAARQEPAAVPTSHQQQQQGRRGDHYGNPPEAQYYWDAKSQSWRYY